MTIAGITILTAAAAYDAVLERLRGAAHVTDTRETGMPCMWAAVLESDAVRIKDELKTLSAWEGVLNVGLVSVSYEDELEEKGAIPCPAHKPRQGGAVCFGETPSPLAGETRRPFCVLPAPCRRRTFSKPASDAASAERPAPAEASAWRRRRGRSVIPRRYAPPKSLAGSASSVRPPALPGPCAP